MATIRTRTGRFPVLSGRAFGPVHSLGNGRMAVYGRGPDLTEVYCPYTSPVLLQAFLEPADGQAPPLECVTGGSIGSGIYRHRLERNGVAIADMDDTMHPDWPAFRRRIRPLGETAGVASFRLDWLHPHHRALQVDLEGRDIRISFEILPGAPLFFHTIADARYGTVVLRSPDPIRLVPAGDRSLQLVVDAPLEILILSGPDVPSVDAALAACLSLGDADWEALDRDRFRRILADRRALPPMPDWMEEVVADVERLVLTQQSEDGGLPSANTLPFGYSRDNYGAGRGLLALGHFAAARAILEFRLRKWRLFGDFRNAEAMGALAPRHPSEEPRVEQTSYMAVLARDYWMATGDDSFIDLSFPMLKDILLAQVPLARHGMLPFNGDETYIAGLFLPRSCLHHGSAEATLLFLLAGEWLLDWAAPRRPQADLEPLRQACADIRSRFREWFLVDGVLVANRPERMGIGELPTRRHGVCEEGMRRGELHDTWLTLDETGHYNCPRCTADGGFRGLPALGPVEIPSVSLLPAYLGTDLLAPEEILSTCRRILASVSPLDRCVGYDPPLLLYALCACGGSEDEIAQTVDRVLGLRDAGGSFHEYYDGGKPVADCNRHRPWESGYALDALLMAGRLGRLPARTAHIPYDWESTP